MKSDVTNTGEAWKVQGMLNVRHILLPMSSTLSSTQKDIH